MKRPNLFNYATSELSHDAFIAWLLSWVDPTYKSIFLHKVSKSVLNKFFELSELEMPDIKELKAKRQFRNIDVYIEITTPTGEQWAILIENKIYTKEHSDQLSRYKSKIIKEENGISKDRIISIYYKMWEQSKLDKVTESNYYHYSRKMMLDILADYEDDGQNDILNDYYSYLKKMQNNLCAYKTKQFKEWEREQWVGFYSKLKKDLSDGNFGYVSNSSGGFQGFWFGFQPTGETDSIYVQIEEEKLCFKVHTHKYDARKPAKWFWHNKIIASAKLKNLDVIKPPVMRMGEYCTIGILNTDKEKYWMVTKENGKLDYEKTLDLLRKALKVVKYAAENYKPAFKS